MSTRSPSDHGRRVIAYVILALAGTFGLWKVSDLASEAHAAADEAQEAADQVESSAALARRAAAVADEESKRRTLEICEGMNENRAIVLRLIEENDEAGGTDFTQVPGFHTLDPQMQDFLLNLSPPPGDTPEEPSRFLVLAREILAAQDCDAIAEGDT